MKRDYSLGEHEESLFACRANSDHRETSPHGESCGETYQDSESWEEESITPMATMKYPFTASSLAMSTFR